MLQPLETHNKNKVLTIYVCLNDVVFFRDMEGMGHSQFPDLYRTAISTTGNWRH